MGSGNSKVDKSQALNLCKARKRFIKQALDSRYALAAAHLSYTQSLRSLGIALRRYAEAEVLIESSLSTSATELEKTPSNFSYPSPSPSHLVDVLDSPLQNGGSPLSPTMARLSYMTMGCTVPMTVVTVNAMVTSTRSFDDSFSVLPPPPPPPNSDPDVTWDYFDPPESFRFMDSGGLDVNLEDLRGWSQFKSSKLDSFGDLEIEDIKPNGNKKASVKSERLSSPERDKDLCTEREDPSEYITHRAKDFLSSIKDIENKFFRASESGKEVSRMLEASKIRVGFSEVKGQTSSSTMKSACQLVCCARKPTLLSQQSGQAGSKVIIWKRSTSSMSSSSRNPLAREVKDDDASDSGSDFVDEFCMIAGRHSSSLERLYAWERKLFDEVKASESIRKVYDRKCNQLRHQFAKGYGSQVIDRTRSVVKDLHSRIMVALHSVDSISKRIEKMRDEELHPQLIELVHGIIRMWKDMLECHHAQYITISLAYHSKAPSRPPPGESRRQIMVQLKHEIECFSLSFRDWVNSLTSYIESLNGWLQNCILHPPERVKNRRPWSPRRALAPPIFVLCRDWLAGLKALASDEVNDSVKSFLSDLNDLMEEGETQKSSLPGVDEGTGSADLRSTDNDKTVYASPPSNLSFIHASLTRILDRLTKFSEGSLKMYEDVRQKSDAALSAYSNCRPIRSQTL